MGHPLAGATISSVEKLTGQSFSADFSFLEREDGERIQFTRSEARALALMVNRPDRVLTRDQILDAVSEPGSDKRDRNIDFLINRIRRKLGDDARDPRFIATRYGEGYVWIDRAPAAREKYPETHVVVGPLRGLENLGDLRPHARDFATALCAAVKSALGAERNVVLLPEIPPPTAFAGEAPRLSVDLTFFEEEGRINCIAAARDFRSDHILALHRLLLPNAPGPGGQTADSAAEVARLLLDNAWHRMATRVENAVPLPVAMFEAASGSSMADGTTKDSDRRLREIISLAETRYEKVWLQNEARLRSLREAAPDDPVLKLMAAVNLHSKYVSIGHVIFQGDNVDTRQDEDEIERLVLEALPHVQAQPDYAITAAKLLHFVDRGYFDLAHALTEDAYRASVSATNSLVLVGQMRGFAGETEAAIRCLDQALNLVTPGSKAHLYTLVIKGQVLKAVADFDRIKTVKKAVYAGSVTTGMFLEPLLANPERPSLRARAVAMMLSRGRARGMLRHMHYVGARLFRDRAHGANVLQSPLSLFAGRFGHTIIPDEITKAFAGYLPGP
ncbi:winged helix-turn-helix domain-containing protein [Limimaricola sp.]|uniref:winged helix-turn-helix domain-containing protein n=1 Tax=Limimaricola sp. TaxID=2211665 RepID=UPI0025BF0A2F|nr:winged helix-turn-helix domain-containing protein [Limimaricola sp.]